MSFLSSSRRRRKRRRLVLVTTRAVQHDEPKPLYWKKYGYFYPPMQEVSVNKHWWRSGNDSAICSAFSWTEYGTLETSFDASATNPDCQQIGEENKINAYYW
eukprot:scaffold17595_cov113-Cylindrotheca_fusiformis.AAC.2